MKQKRKKKKSNSMQYLLMLFMITVGAVCGYYIGPYAQDIINAEKSMSEILLSVLVLFLGIYMATLIQIILHEGGHLLFGLMTGYRFSSFRIGSFMWIKQNGSIQFKRFSLAGTGGQCLMAPPEMKDGKFPYVLYNMGGSIANLFASVLFALISHFTQNSFAVSYFFFIAAAIGVMISLMNAIPLKLDMVNNDGYNAVSLGKNPESLRSFWIQIKFGELSTKGITTRDMPQEWFEMPSPEALKNSMTAFLSTLACSQMMAEKEFEKADQAMRELLQMDTAITGLHRSLMTADLIYCELMGENRPEALMELLDQKQKKFMRAMKSLPSIQRTEYAWALLFENDEQKARQIWQAFEKTAKSYPYPGEISSERELLECAKVRYQDSL